MAVRLRLVCRLVAALAMVAIVLFPQAALAIERQYTPQELEGLGIYFVDQNPPEACNITTVSASLPATIPEPHKTLLAQASSAYNINPQFLAAIFLSENGNAWKSFSTTWATSSAGASGPFQFMPGTWDAYKVDGNGDGQKDILNIYDAAFAAANLLSKGTNINTPLGDLGKPFANPDTFLYVAAAYNWGGGNVQQKTTADSSLSVAPLETQNYLKNVYSLVSSGFTRSGNPNYADPVPSVSGSTSTPVAGSIGIGCSGSVVAGDIVQTALNLAWPERHGLEAKPEYLAALEQYNPAGKSSAGGADCGAFVATVIHATGADPNYPSLGTGLQAQYVLEHPEKYDVSETVSSTADLLPGDIMIVNGVGAGVGHTYIYIGPQPPNGYDQASASLGSRMPNLGKAEVVDSLGRGNYMRARLK